jgi:hypothetical protein
VFKKEEKKAKRFDFFGDWKIAKIDNLGQSL